MNSPIHHNFSSIFQFNNTKGWKEIITIKFFFSNLFLFEWKEIKWEIILSLIGIFILIFILWKNKRKKRKSQTNLL